MKRSNADSKYKWDFSKIYKNIDEWKNDLKKLSEISDEIIKLKNILNIKDNFYKYLDLNKESNMIANKLCIYLHYSDIDQTNEEMKILEGILENKWQEISINISFIAPELKKIGKDTIESWLNENSKYNSYDFQYKKFFINQKFILEERDETLLSKVSKSLSAVHSMYDSLAYADRKDVFIKYKNKDQLLNNSLFMEIMEDTDPIKDQKLRLEASQLFGKNFSEKKHTFAKIYDSILNSEFESVKLRNYESIITSNIMSDFVSKEIYEKLINVGKKYITPLKNYLLLIKNHFKLEKMYPTDKQLKLVKEYNKKFEIEEAKIIIKKALSVLGQEYLDKLDIAWSENKIDYFEDTNKRDGAYSTGGNNIDPIILMNWDYKLNSVNTLAHEIGHSVHTLFADESQEYPKNNYPIILAEVASTINEHLLFDYLYSSTKDRKEKIYLVQQRIFELTATFYRQIQFASFEYEASKIVENGGTLTAESLKKLFKDIELEFGYDVFDTIEDKNSGYGWPRISHFFHSPFYVYKYAIDVVASYKLYQDIKNGDHKSTIDFLKSGGKEEPLKILLNAGVDFTKEETYLPLIDKITLLVKELNNLIN